MSLFIFGLRTEFGLWMISRGIRMLPNDWCRDLLAKRMAEALQEASAISQTKKAELLDEIDSITVESEGI